MESTRQRYNARSTGNSLTELARHGGVNLPLAQIVVANIIYPRYHAWERNEGNYWAGKWDPVSDHPFTWGNLSLFIDAPTSYVFRYLPYSSNPKQDLFYVLTLNETNQTPKR